MGWLCGSAPKEVVQSTASKKPDAAEAASSAAAPAPAESKVKVYGLALSTCTRRVLNALEEKGVPYELVIVDLFKGGNKEADYLAKQPFAQIPALEDGDVRIFESRAIVRYIANKWASQGTDLWGKDAQTIANTDTWMEPVYAGDGAVADVSHLLVALSGAQSGGGHIAPQGPHRACVCSPFVNLVTGFSVSV